MSSCSRLVLLVCVLCVSLIGAVDPECVTVVPAENYLNALYEGHWFEIGKTQTPGGAQWQQSCWCDSTEFTSPDPTLGDGEATYSCRIDGPQGNLSSATADLIYGGQPGQFTQVFRYPFAPELDYNIVYIDEEVAMEYDCYTNVFGVTNYCVHYMSRTPSILPEKLNMLLELSESLGLNNQNIDYKTTKQEGCW